MEESLIRRHSKNSKLFLHKSDLEVAHEKEQEIWHLPPAKQAHAAGEEILIPQKVEEVSRNEARRLISEEMSCLFWREGEELFNSGTALVNLRADTV